MATVELARSDRALPNEPFIVTIVFSVFGARLLQNVGHKGFGFGRFNPCHWLQPGVEHLGPAMNRRAARLAFTAMMEAHISSEWRHICLLRVSEQACSSALRSALTAADAGRHE